MKKVNLDTWIQLIGIFSIVASLIFVGLEMRQSQRIAQAGQQQDRTASFLGLLGANSEAGVDWQSTVYEENSEYGEKFTLPEIVRRNNYHAHLFTYENDYFQYSQGLMPQSVWDAKLVALTFFSNQCDMRDLMDSRKNVFPRRFVEIINNLPDECSE
jgi:hypothetical protein|tara:strand:- start:970 stop:1440 length:471 start_codon:yes stop_codon:yes gene_type:complete